ncbi:S1C family serine protease [Staphylococcus canis]|uniref:Serine protease HtrA-like n=1 Tax=Staphylococcus canis TaxID=2724942 RepID=A0ABS0T995_9STAP|nr:S1C family serine protease [Staphylococcus canis]MBI5975252.1 serine protease [Staphylococcus canis]
MKNDEKHVIPRRQYKRQRREFFHNEEREQRIIAQQKQQALKAQKEKEQIKNNEERVKDNLRKARVEKITHEDYEHKMDTSSNDGEQTVSGLTTSSGKSASQKDDAISKKQQNLYKQQAKHIQQAHQKPKEQSTPPASLTEKETHNDENVQADTKHQYHSQKDWTEKVTTFLSKEWAKMLVLLAILLILFLLYSIFNNVNHDRQGNNETVNAQSKTVTNTMKNAEIATHSVVSIENNNTQVPDTVEDVQSQAQIENESGSGVVYKKVGDTLYILTNAHVVGDRKTHELTYDKNKKIQGQVIGKDKWTDIAVMTVKAPKNNFLKPLSLGDSNHLVLGEPIIVVGNPLSLDFQNTVGEGIISGLDRNVPVDIDRDNQYDMLMHAFQVDAPINPGDSGGAVIDQNGNLIGIASLKISMPNVENMAFAIPINDALKIADTLVDKGEVQHPNTMIKLENVADIDATARQTLNIQKSLQDGVIVRAIDPNSPAQGTDLKVNDVIIAVDGQPIKNTLEYRQKIFQHTDMQKNVKLKVSQDGEVKEISFKLK